MHSRGKGRGQNGDLGELGRGHGWTPKWLIVPTVFGVGREPTRLLADGHFPSRRSLASPVPSGSPVHLPLSSYHLHAQADPVSSRSLSIPTTALHALSSSNTQRTQSISRRSSGSTIPGGSPTNGSACRLFAPGARSPLPSSSHLVPKPCPAFTVLRGIPSPRCAERQTAPLPVVMSSSKALTWNLLPTHGFQTHTSPLQTM